MAKARLSDLTQALPWLSVVACARLAAEERQPFPESRGGLYRKMCWSIGPVLRAAPGDEAGLAPARLALLDLAQGSPVVRLSSLSP